MKRLLIYTLFFLLFISCESNSNKVAPVSEFAGGVPNINVSIDDKSDTDLSAWATVPFDIKREQVRPTLLSILKALREKYPHYDRITIFLCPSEDLRGMGICAGRAAYNKGTLEINYGVPTDQQIEGWNADRLKPLFPGDKNTLPPLARITKDDFDIGKKVFLLGDAIDKKYVFQHQHDLKTLSDGQLFSAVAKEIRLSSKKVEYYYQLFQESYSLSWGNETIKF